MATAWRGWESSPVAACVVVLGHVPFDSLRNRQVLGDFEIGVTAVMGLVPMAPALTTAQLLG